MLREVQKPGPGPTCDKVAGLGLEPRSVWFSLRGFGLLLSCPRRCYENPGPRTELGKCPHWHTNVLFWNFEIPLLPSLHAFFNCRSPATWLASPYLLDTLCLCSLWMPSSYHFCIPPRRVWGFKSSARDGLLCKILVYKLLYVPKINIRWMRLNETQIFKLSGVIRIWACV